MSVGSVRDFDFHPDEDDVRVFTVDAAGVLRFDPAVFVSHARCDDAILWHYAFADHWFKVNLTTDLNGAVVETGASEAADGFAVNCDLATPMWQQDMAVYAVDLLLDVLVRSDGRTYRVCDVDELAQAIAGGPLVTFLALRSLARDDENWQEPGSGRMLLVIRSRAELRRLTTVLGVLLTLLVVATGLRRRALLAYDPGLPIPAAQVLLYGLLFAVLLGLMYLASTSAIDRRAALFLDEFAPLPDPGAGDLGTPLARRNDLGAVIGAGGSWRSFETTVVIVAPLLTALIGIATGN
jgi:hypothetical protein